MKKETNKTNKSKEVKRKRTKESETIIESMKKNNRYFELPDGSYIFAPVAFDFD